MYTKRQLESSKLRTEIDDESKPATRLKESERNFILMYCFNFTSVTSFPLASLNNPKALSEI